jgi:hypothetical protein
VSLETSYLKGNLAPKPVVLAWELEDLPHCCRAFFGVNVSLRIDEAYTTLERSLLVFFHSPGF